MRDDFQKPINWTVDMSAFSPFFGCAAFLYALVMFSFGPFNNMENKRERFTIVVGRVYTGVTSLNIFFCLVCVFLFRGALSGTDIVVSELEGAVYAVTVFVLIVDILATYVVASIPYYNYILQLTGHQSLSRGLFWVVSVILAIVIPDLNDLVTVVSSFSLTYTTFIIPPLMLIYKRWNEEDIGSNFELALCILIFCGGFFCLCWTTVSAVYHVYHVYSDPKSNLHPFSGSCS